MTNLPRRPIKPLAPPPDSFDRVLATARRRRRIRGLIAASSTMVVVLVAAASFALGASINANDRLDPASSFTSNPSSTEDPTSADSSHPKPTPKKSRIVAGGGKSAVGGEPLTWLRGRAIDPDGNGIPGLYVLPGAHGTFNSVGWSNARTNADGYYSIPCPNSPVLLATWRLNVPYSGASAGGAWAATYVGSKSGAPVVPRCGGREYETTLVPGATLTGKVIDSGDCVPGDNYHLWVYFRYHQTTAIRLHGLYSGDTFTISGLPAGTYMVGLRMQMKEVPVAAGTTTEANVDFTCDGTTDYPTDGTPTTQTPSTGEASPEVTPSPTPSEPVIN
jgi:hypothetical protein